MAIAQFATTVKSYEHLNAWIGARDSKKLAHNTFAERIDGETIGIRYHETIIAELWRPVRRSDGESLLETLLITTGGWNSVTTTGRLDRILLDFIGAYTSPFDVHRQGGLANLHHRATGEDYSFSEGHVTVVKDGEGVEAHVYQSEWHRPIVLKG